MKADKSKECTPEEARRFRSGSGSVLYLSQDRVDIQFATKLFASAMSKPTQQAVKCLKHLIIYLKGPGHEHSYFPMFPNLSLDRFLPAGYAPLRR